MLNTDRHRWASGGKEEVPRYEFDTFYHVSENYSGSCHWNESN